MSLKEQLRKISEKSLTKKEFNDDVKAFTEYIMHNWVKRVALEANQGCFEMPLVAFTSGAEFNNNKIHSFLRHGLLDYIKEQINDLGVYVECYMVNKKTNGMDRIEHEVLNNLYIDDEYKYVYVIKLSWA